MLFRSTILRKIDQFLHFLLADLGELYLNQCLLRLESIAKNHQIEFEIQQLKILSSAETPPFEITETKGEVHEDVRLKYRYLDLRRSDMQHNIRFRHKFIKSIRNYMDNAGFVEIETPILTKSSPEGARDFLVPSRISNGKFYALPQAPQQFKQLLMIAGFEKPLLIIPASKFTYSFSRISLFFLPIALRNKSAAPNENPASF